MKKLLICCISLLALWAFHSPPQAQAACEVQTATVTYANGAFIGGDLCDANGNKKTTLGGTAGGGFGTATAAAPTIAEGTGTSFSFDLSGNARVTLGTLLSGEDQTNNLLMTSGGAVRVTQLVGTGGIPSTASDATGTAMALPVGKKTFHGIVTCTGTCVQTQKIYGAYESSATVAKSVLVCTLAMSASTTAIDYCIVDVPFLYWFPVTSLTSGTTPLAGLFAMY